MNQPLQDLAYALRSAQHVAALTGAGISTDSGIPDFRGPNGLWTKDPSAERLSTLEHYMNDREVRVRAWQARLTHPAWTAQPNEAHLALARLQAKGRLHELITQNIDGLHQAAGMEPETLVEIHGTLHEVTCMSCAERAPMERALERVRRGEEDPACRTCGGILKSATISFGQNLVEADLRRAHESAQRSDLFLAIGTSLGVYPVAHLPQAAIETGARLAILNAEPTPLDPLAEWIVREPLGVALPRLVDLV
jgi:NAD-dependent deacetylase